MEHILNLKQDNYIIYNNKINLYRFYYYFYELLENKNNNVEIYLGSKKISYKDTKLINIMDVEKLILNLKFEKNSMLYDCILKLLGFVDIDEQNKIFSDISLIIDNLIKDNFNDLEYYIDDNFIKTVSSNLNIIFKDDDINKNINNLLKKYITLDDSKTYIIFYESDFIQIKFKEYEYNNVYFFDISKSNKLEKYNICLFDDFTDFNYNVLLDEIEKNWPQSFNKNDVKNVLNHFYHIYVSNINYYSDKIDEIILNKVLNIIYKNNRTIEYDVSRIDNNIINFLTN